MNSPAVASRRMQFSAGPESCVFYACHRHRDDLKDGWYANDLFFTCAKWPIELVDPADELRCDSCRAEDGE